MCCNGVIFADVQVRGADEIGRLRSLGLELEPKPRKSKMTGAAKPTAVFVQPCSAFDGCRCRIYAERPGYCRRFECLLLKRVEAGETARPAALRVIRTARARADKVRRLLRELADTDEHLPLASRFRRTTRRVELLGIEEPLAKTYGDLTLALHDLNLLLSDAFYPRRRCS